MTESSSPPPTTTTPRSEPDPASEAPQGSPARGGGGGGGGGGDAGTGGALSRQLAWFISLRWVAAGVAIVLALLDWRWLGWFPASAAWILVVGLVVLAYNAVLWAALRSLVRRRTRVRRRQGLLMHAWVQVLLDLAALALLALLTGGLASPLIGFFVFHMVFASLLLPRQFAYGAAGAALALLGAGLWVWGAWPDDLQGRLAFAGWVVTLLFTVFLANRITRGLRQHRRQLARRNRRIRRMAGQLRRQQQTLIQHEKMVAMGQMAAGVTHEIANPLASMDSVLQLMQRRPDRVRPESVATLREQVQRINQIIQQMKTFAHPAEGQQQTVPVAEVIDHALDMLRFDKRLQQVKLERRYTPDVGAIPFIPQALQQVLVNLIINALDAMAGTPEPRLILATSRQDGWCAIDVIDNGHGIPSEHLRRLFEPFFTTKPVGQGTGLGLSISYNLIEKQGGDIRVRSAPGVGTTFTIRLPIGPAAATGDGGTAAARAAVSRPREASGAGVAAPEKAGPGQSL